MLILLWTIRVMFPLQNKTNLNLFLAVLRKKSELWDISTQFWLSPAILTFSSEFQVHISPICFFYSHHGIIFLRRFKKQLWFGKRRSQFLVYFLQFWSTVELTKSEVKGHLGQEALVLCVDTKSRDVCWRETRIGAQLSHSTYLRHQTAFFLLLTRCWQNLHVVLFFCNTNTEYVKSPELNSDWKERCNLGK